MLRFFTLIFIISLTSLMAKTNFLPFQTSLLKVDGTYLYIKDSPSFTVGSSGIVLHSFDESHKTIVATVEVVAKKQGEAVLKFKKFKGLQQSALPLYNITPKKGDTIILNYLYQRAMAVVPDSETLQYVTSKFNDIEWIHPDIFGSKLAVDYTPTPTKDDFTNECSQNSYALLFFAVEGKGYFVDCNSFKILARTDLPQTSQKTTPKVPFYSRLDGIKGRMFGLMGGDGINNYDRYYKKMLNVK